MISVLSDISTKLGANARKFLPRGYSIIDFNSSDTLKCREGFSFFLCAGCAQWCYGCDELVFRHLQLEKPSHNSARSYPSVDSCVVPWALAPDSFSLHVPDWGLELSLPFPSTSLHGCQAFTGWAHWWSRWTGGRIQCCPSQQGSRGQ